MTQREPWPTELLERVRETGALAILAGCDAAEIIELCRETVAAFYAARGGAAKVPGPSTR